MEADRGTKTSKQGDKNTTKPMKSELVYIGILSQTYKIRGQCHTIIPAKTETF